MKKCFLLPISLLFASLVARGQQDALYSQYMQNPLTINPAYTGIYNMFSATAISRLQWVGMQGAPLTNSLTAHSTVARNRLGVGAVLLSDRYGVSSSTEAHATAAYKLRLSDNEEHVLSFGMQAGLVGHVADYSGLTLKQDDPNFAGGRVAATAPNFGAGLFYKSERLFAGLSAPKLLNSDFAGDAGTATRYRRHLFLSGGYLFDLGQAQLKPSLLLKYVEGAPVSADINASLLLRDFVWLGASLRNLNAAVLMAQVQLSDMLRLGYALDIPTTSVVKASYGTHELMLNIDLKLLPGHDIGLRYF